MSITKDQASDLKNLHERVTATAINLEYAKIAHDKAKADYNGFVWEIQQEKK